MCGIFGYLNYGSVMEDKDLKDILKSLAYESAVRGTDATGIAFINHKNKLEIQKAPKPAYTFKMILPEAMPKTVIGHTRHTTQGSEKQNINNHPFQGKIGKEYFALAHNGILYNDGDLRNTHRLPKSQIQTDSYIAVQLLEQEKRINLNTIKNMAEAVQGSFVFTILDNAENLYLVKGDNPITIVHHRGLKLYLYASTDKILASAISDSSILKYFIPTEKNASAVEYIELKEGDILKIDTKGKTSKAAFTPNPYDFGLCNNYFWSFYGSGQRDSQAASIGTVNKPKSSREKELEEEYIFNYFEELQSAAKSMGYDEEMIDYLINEGLTFEEIEEYLYQDCFY